MKKYLIFAVSFLLLFFIFQVLSGMLLTYMYTPNVEEAWKASANLSQEVIIKSSHSPFLLTIVIGLLSASVAYFLSGKIIKQ